MRKGWQWMLLAMIGPLLISGCEPTQILDETTLITVMGFDVLEDNRIRATASAPVVSSLVSQKEQVVSATDTTLNGIMNKLDLQLDRRPKLGQLRIALYSKEMAKKGMIEFVGVMDRVEVGLRPYLGIVDGKSYDLVQADYPTQGNIGLYLYYTIYKNVRGEQLPSSTLHEFMRDYYSEGNDPYLPFIERKGNDINIKGVALFKGDQYVDWVKPEQAFYIKLVRDQFRAGFFQLSIPTAGLGIQDQRKSNKQETSPIALETINSKKNIKLVSQHPPPLTFP
ncbi:Ger(x)C family spore germination protein [Brevibacillus invocatus]|uniref:Ger(X)C family spore germination protein n=1 Tax=Brevibacillus invocatus TaxID=173959 RepID=A0A3M8CEP8_9BACL|nr:Ger(x)C family spore germination C-terminal domain-containing protein [Brevibacillus invocatus]RNB74236.1 Ger(x)C family spore germination protein [Brevibacillus invocatus]